MLALSGCTGGANAPPSPASAPPDATGSAVLCPIEEDTDGDTVSFQRDLLPFLSVTCAFGGCHDDRSRLAGLYLGPNFTDGEADAAARDAVHQALLSPASTTNDLPRVTPFEPSQSFLMLKIQGCQNSTALTCKGPAAAPCGARMPALSNPLPLESRRMIARWIAAGAPFD